MADHGMWVEIPGFPTDDQTIEVCEHRDRNKIFVSFISSDNEKQFVVVDLESKTVIPAGAFPQ